MIDLAGEVTWSVCPLLSGARGLIFPGREQARRNQDRGQCRRSSIGSSAATNTRPFRSRGGAAPSHFERLKQPFPSSSKSSRGTRRVSLAKTRRGTAKTQRKNIINSYYLSLCVLR